MELNQMYYPYFRGKQYELITIRECAELFADQKFVPIIEPVKEQLSGLTKALDCICEKDGSTILIVNPNIGDHCEDGANISNLILNNYRSRSNIIVGILLTESSTAQEAFSLIERHQDNNIALIHSGFSAAKELVDLMRESENVKFNIFVEDHCGKLYQKHFGNRCTRVLLRDGFERRRNRDHPVSEFFSDLHATYDLEGMDGFGDYLIVGDDYSEGGGPAYTIAIHLTYIDDDRDSEMHIYHFKSDRQDTPKDPAGKFAEALDKLIRKLADASNKFYDTSAIEEFRDLHARKHYPGLGYVKKLSMMHHIETIAEYFRK